MSLSPHPLNQAVIAQALHDLRTGQLRRAEAMGFPPRCLEALKSPALASLLSNTKVPWCRVTVNGQVVERLLDRERDFESEVEAIDRMLRLGASTEMVAEFHGLTHQEVALRRQVLGLPERRGRWPVLTEAEDAALWEHWSTELKARSIDTNDDAAMLAVSMDLAERQNLPLSVVWGAIRVWIEQGST
jgi:hypothetical protein